MSSSEGIALAVDLGTTTIAASLVDPATGLRIASGGCMNPQRRFGSDVITRMSVAEESPDIRHEMAGIVNVELERLALVLLQQASLVPESLRRVAIAGNPAMEHLLLDLPVESLARIPYRPLFKEGRNLRTADLGWELDLDAYIFPLPGGFVGGDLVAFLYGQQLSGPLPHDPSPRLFLDLGTNAEIALTVGDLIYATSAASGPAFEGGNLTCGMTAVAGAVREVVLDGEKLAYTVIGNVSPSGLCGTGALSLLSVLLSAGLIDGSGRLRGKDEIESNLANRITEVSGEAAFTLYRDAKKAVFLTQGDIRQIQLAKGAIRAGIEVILQRSGVSTDDLDKLIVSGSFGAAAKPAHFESLGIIPSGLGGKTSFISEGALSGVERFLTNSDPGGDPGLLLENFRIVPLSGNPEFETFYIKFMEFGGAV